jgi:hypothetical protein
MTLLNSHLKWQLDQLSIIYALFGVTTVGLNLRFEIAVGIVNNAGYQLEVSAFQVFFSCS